MLIECSKCGAPLDAKDGTRTTKCNYCGASNRASETRTIAAVTPPGWAPPPVWTPPPGLTIEGKELAYKAGTAVAGFTLAMVLLPLIGTCLIFALVGGMLFMFLPSSRSASPNLPVVSGPGFTQATWDGTAPLTCGGSDELTFDGVSANLPGQTAVLAAGNCHVVLTNCTISAAQAVAATGNAHVVLRGGSVSGEGVALSTSGNAHILVDGARVVGTVAAGQPGQITGVP